MISQQPQDLDQLANHQVQTHWAKVDKRTIHPLGPYLQLVRRPAAPLQTAQHQVRLPVADHLAHQSDQEAPVQQA
jgi:hypothetical protein